mgnify:CR=1 FL=1
MKKLLILIVAAAVFLHFFPQPKLETWAKEQKDYLLEMFSSATDTKVRLSAKKVRSDLEERFNQFTDDEKAYTLEITKDSKSVVSFYREKCGKTDTSVQLRPANKKFVCETISKYRAFM